MAPFVLFEIGMPKLIVALVIYKPQLEVLSDTLIYLRNSFDPFDNNFVVKVVDNSNDCNNLLDYSFFKSCGYSASELIYIKNSSNVGFGHAHNQLLSTESEYHLIFNPDIELDVDALKIAMQFMDTHPECGLLTPYATWDNGVVQRLCKRYPTVFDLLLRGFAPCCIKKLFHKRLAHYEMADVINEQDVYWDPPIVSGCFMLFKTEVWKQLGGFDPRFFLYFEDFDLSLRAGDITRVAYVPSVKLVHHGGHASRKGWKHIKMFIRSMITFFNIHGWRWW